MRRARIFTLAAGGALALVFTITAPHLWLQVVFAALAALDLTALGATLAEGRSRE